MNLIECTRMQLTSLAQSQDIVKACTNRLEVGRTWACQEPNTRQAHVLLLKGMCMLQKQMHGCRTDTNA
jgi:hypothetical protein